MRLSISLESCGAVAAVPCWQLPAFRSELILRGNGLGGLSGTWEPSVKSGRNRKECLQIGVGRESSSKNNVLIRDIMDLLSVRYTCGHKAGFYSFKGFCLQPLPLAAQQPSKDTTRLSYRHGPRCPPHRTPAPAPRFPLSTKFSHTSLPELVKKHFSGSREDTKLLPIQIRKQK